MESLNLTIADPTWKPPEFEIKFSDDEQRKIYRDEISPLTDEERKALKSRITGKGCLLFLIIVTAVFIGGLFLYYGDDSRTAGQCSGLIVIGAGIVFLINWHGNANTRKELAANRKRIVIAPVERIARIPNPGTKHKSYSAITYLSTPDQVSEKLHDHERWEEGDMLETHLIYRLDGSSRAILEMTKVAAAKREKTKSDLQQQVFLKDEIVSLNAEDRKKIVREFKEGNGCLFSIVLVLVAVSVLSIFFANAELLWRAIFGGVPALLAALLIFGWWLQKSKVKKQIAVGEEWQTDKQNADTKKRVIVAPLAKLSQVIFLGKPTKFYAELKVAGEIFKQEIPAEAFLDLNAGEIVELQIKEHSDSAPTFWQITKIADAPEENRINEENAEIL